MKAGRVLSHHPWCMFKRYFLRIFWPLWNPPQMNHIWVLKIRSWHQCNYHRFRLSRWKISLEFYHGKARWVLDHIWKFSPWSWFDFFKNSNLYILVTGLGQTPLQLYVTTVSSQWMVYVTRPHEWRISMAQGGKNNHFR